MVPPLAEIVVSPLEGGHETPLKVPQPEAEMKLLTATSPLPALGSVSLKVKLVRSVSAGAVKVNLSVEVFPISMVDGEKLFVTATPSVMVYTSTGADAGDVL